MRFKDVRQHKNNALKDVLVNVESDTWGTFIVCVEYDGVSLFQNCVPDHCLKKTVEKLKKQIVRSK